MLAVGFLYSPIAFAIGIEGGYTLGVLSVSFLILTAVFYRNFSRKYLRAIGWTSIFILCNAFAAYMNDYPFDTAWSWVQALAPFAILILMSVFSLQITSEKNPLKSHVQPFSQLILYLLFSLPFLWLSFFVAGLSKGI